LQEFTSENDDAVAAERQVAARTPMLIAQRKEPR
jgi:hypothetical protein